MKPATSKVAQLVAASNRFARLLVTIGENRLKLLIVEIQEERQHLLRFVLLALGAAVSPVWQAWPLAFLS